MHFKNVTFNECNLYSKKDVEAPMRILYSFDHKTSVILWRRLIFPDWNYKVGTSNLLFPFSKIYIWDLD